MKRFLCLGLFLAGFAGLSSAAQAADVANFQAKCTWNSTYTSFLCEFSAERPQSNPSRCENGTDTFTYRWEFDDGTSAGYNSSYWQISHRYNPPPPGQSGYLPKLLFKCTRSDGSSYTVTEKQRYLCVFGIGTSGCIQVNGTWM